MDYDLYDEKKKNILRISRSILVLVFLGRQTNRRTIAGAMLKQWVNNNKQQDTKLEFNKRD